VDVFQELALCAARVSHNTYVQVASDGRTRRGDHIRSRYGRGSAHSNMWRRGGGGRDTNGSIREADRLPLLLVNMRSPAMCMANHRDGVLLVQATTLPLPEGDALWRGLVHPS